MKKIISFGLVLGFLPSFVFASPADGTWVFSVLGLIGSVLAVVVPILITLAVIWFVWGVIQYMTAKEDDQKKAGKSKIINGLIGMFVIVSFWGIIYLARGVLGVGGGNIDQADIPCIPSDFVTCPAV